MRIPLHEMQAHIQRKLEMLGINSFEDTNDIFDKWSLSYRSPYHGTQHLFDILTKMDKDGYRWYSDKVNDSLVDKLFLLAVFHDVIYDPKRDDNELQSVDYYMSRMVRNCYEDVCRTILDTETGNIEDPLSEVFIKNYDRYNLYYGSFNEILNNTKELFKEQQFLDFKIWKEKQIKFLENYINDNKNIEHVIEYIKNWQPKIGIYAGSFNPLHKGHDNILRKAENIFDKVIIARGINPEKNNEYLELPDKLNYHQIDKFNGFLTDYMDSLGYDTVLIRGLRNSTDLQYEMTQFQYLQDMKLDIKIVNIFCDKEYEHISSSAIRNLGKLNKEIVKKYLI